MFRRYSRSKNQVSSGGGNGGNNSNGGGGGGCLALGSKVCLWNFESKPVEKVKVGDVLLGYEDYAFKPSKVVKAELHTGNFRIIRFIAQDREGNIKDLAVTANEPIYERRKSRVERADKIKLGDLLSGLVFEGNAPMLKPFKIVKIETWQADKAVHIETETKHYFADFKLVRFTKV